MGMTPHSAMDQLSGKRPTPKASDGIPQEPATTPAEPGRATEVPSNLPFDSEMLYHRLRRRLLMYFQRRRASNPADLADETLARVVLFAKRNPSHSFSSLDRFVFGVARMVLLEYLRETAHLTSLKEDDLLDDRPPFHSPSAAEIAVQQLSDAERELLEEYFVDGARAETIAARLKMSIQGVRTRVFRVKQRLRDYSHGGLCGALNPKNNEGGL